MRFQLKAGLTPDGIPGQQTIAAMKKALKIPSEEIVRTVYQRLVGADDF